MAESRRGLGRGLSALIEESEGAQTPEARRAAGVEELPIELVRRNPEQPRRRFDEAQLEELAASIRDKGVLQPILVRPHPTAAGAWQIVAGERRWQAAQRAGLREIPALTRDLDDLQVAEIALIENIQRADLSPLEEARGYQAVMTRFGRTQEAMSEVVGKSRSHVANTLRLLTLPQALQDHLEAGRLTPGHARALASADDPEGLARIAVDRALSVRETETLARKGASPASRPRGAPRKDADTLSLEADLTEILGLDVEIRDRGQAGELRIKYATLEQLDDLCRRLTTRGPH